VTILVINGHNEWLLTDVKIAYDHLTTFTAHYEYKIPNADITDLCNAMSGGNLCDQVSRGGLRPHWNVLERAASIVIPGIDSNVAWLRGQAYAGRHADRCEKQPNTGCNP
jgi:hypothetical protein